MRYSGIGGQAVLEGVMMKNADQYAVAVRRPDQEIEVMTKEYSGLTGTAAKKIPIVRGVLSFIDSMVLGISTLLYSSTFYEEEEDTKQKKNQKTDEEKGPHEISKSDKAFMGATTVISFVIAIAIFVILPYYLSQLFQKAVPNSTATAIFEGVLRLVIFILYIYIISRSKDIQRVFMYHGAEHKCINCIEHGLDLTVENVRISSKEHKRCGTSFLMFVVILSIILFLFIRVDSHTMRIVIRLILVPVIAGISYEVLRLAGRYDNPVINAISKPGLALQHMTTKEPDDDMIEVGIASVEAVFDWRSYVDEYRQQENPDACQPTCF